MSLLPTPRRRRAIVAGLASVVLVLATAVAFGATASADTPPPGQGTLFADLGQTQFPGEGQAWCSYGVPEYQGEYEQQGWVQIPAGVHHVLLTAIGDAGSSGNSGGAQGGLGGVVSAILPTSPGKIFYASPDSSVTQDTSVEANGGRASFISTMSPATLVATHTLDGLPNPDALCFTEFDPEDYPQVMPASDLVLVAGGGGGGGDFGTAGRGGNAGPNGVNGSGAGGAGGGGGGTQSGGGAGGTGADFQGYNGTYLSGGDNFNPNVVIGGGGGAGYWGGGNGSGNGSTPSGGGGGGSNYIVGLPSDGVSKVISNGATTQASQVSIVPIYEPTVTVSAPVNPSVVNTPTTITVTVSGLPTAATLDDEGTTVTVRPAASGTVSMVVNGVTVTQSFDPLVGTDTGVRTATFTVTGHSSGTTNYVATYNGDASQESAYYFGDLVNPESSASFAEGYKPAVTATLSGSMTYGDSTATFTHSETLPGGVTISGTATCTTAGGGLSLSGLSAATYSIDPASCSGLTLGGPNAASYGILYAGSVSVAPRQVTAYITGSQPSGGAATFAYSVAPTEYSDAVIGSPTCTTLDDGTAIGPGLSRGVYTLGTCTGLQLAAADIHNYTLTVTPAGFVAGTSSPTLTSPTLASAVVGSPLDTRVTLAGGDAPSGEVSLSFYDSDSCTGTPLSTGSSSVTGNGDYDTGTVIPQNAGTFSAEATYSGDTFNSTTVTSCDVIAVAQAAAGVTFSIPATGVVGQPLSASAAFSSSVPRVGNSELRMFLFPSSDTTCSSGVALIDEDVNADSDGVYTTPSYTPTAPGTYRWVILYSGDANHVSDNSICALTTVVSSPPAITSSSTATFAAGGTSSFTITTTPGSPAGTSLSAAGALPVGVTFTDDGTGTATLSGTPDAASGGAYPLTITAANSAASATQHFVLTVTQSAGFTSADTATFSTGVSSSFTVGTAAGYPTLTNLVFSGTLPAGINFTDNHDGTATLSGTPAAATGGDYPLTITASNGSLPNATQNVTITVTQPVAIGATGNAVFQAGDNGTYTVTTTPGDPATTGLTLHGTLPHGLSFSDNGDGTGTLTGTPSTGSGGDYPVTITASNGIGIAAVQQLDIAVNEPSSITSDDATTFSTGVSSSFTVGTAAGYPTLTNLVFSGTLPTGIHFTDNHDGTATLSGTPAAATGGDYPLTITASNGVLPDAAQDFTLTVTQPVAIDATDDAVFQVGDSGTHTVVTAPGYPVTTSLTPDGALPPGLSFTDNGDGTGTLIGTPQTGSGGDYPVTISASNGVGTAAVQQLDITVNEQPTITSADSASATIGVNSSFTVTTAPGYPAAYTLSESGALPPGLSLAIAGGSATISGIPTGPALSYPITLIASNGIAPDTVQTLTFAIVAAAAVPLPLAAPVGGNGINGVPTATHPGESFTASTTGFAAGAPITWGIFSSAQVLTTSVADLSGGATATLTIPAGFTGLHTVVATGVAPDGLPLVVSATTTVIDPAATASLPATGVAVGTSPAAAILMLALGLALVFIVRLRRRRRLP
jgi:hypothetical protein